MPHVSKSQLNQLMTCPKLYWYERIEGVESKTGIGALLGGAYHAVWEQFFTHKMTRGENQAIEWAADIFATEFSRRVSEAVEAGNFDYDEKEYGENKDTGIRCVEAYHPFAVKFDPLFVEKQFELSIPGHDWTLFGYIDFAYKSWLVDPQGDPLLDDEGEPRWVPVVVDHKTAGSSPYDPGKEGRYDAWLSDNQFSHEAIIYALAYRVLFGQNEDRFEYHTAVKTKVAKVLISPIKVGDLQINWFLDLAIEQIEKIKRGYFERNTNAWLHSPKWCPAWDQCHGIPKAPGEQGVLKVV